MTQQAPKPDPSESLLCAIMKDDGIAVVRVLGRGNFSNSLAFKNFTIHLGRKHPDFDMVVDMSHCESMDSTFMGVLAGIAINARREKRPPLTLINTSDHCTRLLKNLGVLPLLELRGDHNDISRAEEQLQPTHPGKASQLEQLRMTLKAHRELVKLDEQNELRFQAVIEYLEKSLEEEKEKEQG